MASNPWEILDGINNRPSIGDLYAGARQRRIAELMMARRFEQEDRERAIQDEERQAIADAATPAPSQPAPRPGVEVKRAIASRFSRLSDLTGAAPANVGQPTLADYATASPAAAPTQTIDEYGRKAMVASLGQAGYERWKQKHGITEIGAAQSAPAASAPLSRAAPSPASGPVSQWGEESQGAGISPPDNLIPEGVGIAEAASQPSAAPSGIGLNPAGLQRLQRVNPKLAFSLAKMDADQRTAAYKAIEEQVALESRVIGAVRAAPEAEQQAVYANIRNYLGAKGITNLPEQWDPDMAETHQRMGLTAMQAFQDDRAERRLTQDIADDEADNARADRNTDSLVEDRVSRRGLVARGQDLMDARGRRGQNMASSDRQRGQNMTSADRRYATDRSGARKRPVTSETIPTIRSAAERDKLPKGALYRAPDGTINRKN